MAEKFEKPQKFTKAWWGYVCDYYKWPIIITLCAILGVCYYAYEKSTEIHPDIRFAMSGNIVLDPVAEDLFQDRLDSMVKDINGDGKTKTARPMYYIFLESTHTGAEYQSAMSQRLSLELSSQETFLFVFDKSLGDHYINLPDNAFLKTEKWAGELSPESLMQDAYGRNYGVSLKNSRILKECGIDGSDLYLMVRICTKDGEEYDNKYEESLRIAKELIKEN